MEVAVVLGAGIVVVVVAVVAVRRRGSRDTQSVAGYRETLDVLGHLGGGGRRVRGPTDLEPPHAPRPGAVQSLRSVRPVAERPRADAPSSESHDGSATFDDSAGLSHPERPARRDRALAAMDHPARGLGFPIAVLVVVLAAGGVAAYAVVRAHRGTPPPSAASHSSGHTGSSTSGHSKGHTTPPRSIPARYTAVSSTASSATYAPPNSTYSLTVGATTTDCWMSVTSSTGTMVLAQTFAAGASASLSLSGRSTIVIGAPKVAKLAVGGVPVVLPTGVAGPFTVTFDPS